MRGFINDYFSYILLIAGIAGLFIPEPGDAASYVILVLLFIIIFSSCFQLELKKEVFRKESKNAVIFTIFRYILIPLLFFFLLRNISEFYAFALFFLFILPSAVAAPPVTIMFARNINLALIILASSSIVATFTIPLFIPWLSGDVATINQFSLFQTVFITIIMPFFVHLPFRRNQKMKSWLTNNLQYITVTCISLILMIAISKNKETVFQQPELVLIFIMLSLVFYAGLYALGWYMMPSRQFHEKATFTISSGLNNIGLGISLAIIYLPALVAVFCIMAQFAWIISLIPVRYILRKIKERS